MSHSIMETGIRITDMVYIAVCYADGVTLLVRNSIYQ